jgi:hypothetical protein
VRQFPHAEIIDNEQRRRRDRIHILPPRAIDNRFGQFIVRVRLTHGVRAL